MKRLSASIDYIGVFALSTLAGSAVALIGLGMLMRAAGGEPGGQWLPTSGILGLAYGAYSTHEHHKRKQDEELKARVRADPNLWEINRHWLYREPGPWHVPLGDDQD